MSLEKIAAVGWRLCFLIGGSVAVCSNTGAVWSFLDSGLSCAAAGWS